MAYDRFVSLDQTAISKLSFLGKDYQYLFLDSSGLYSRGIVYEISTDSAIKIRKRLEGDTTGTIVSGDKVYVLSGCCIPQFKIKDYLKTKGASMVSNVDEATKIIGNVAASQGLIPYRSKGSSYSLIDKVQFAEICNSEDPNDLLKFLTLRETDSSRSVDIKTKYQNLMVSYQLKEEVLKQHDAFTVLLDNDTTPCIIYPLGINIIYNILLKKIPVINDDHIFKDLEKFLIVDKDSYESIRNMLASSDESNHKIGADVLSSCDIAKSLYWIWKLAAKYQSCVNNLSSYKHIRLFIKKSDWNKVSSMDAEDYLEYAHKKGLLTSESFALVINDAAQLYAHRMSSDLFRIEMKPSSKYRSFSTGNEVFVFGKDPGDRATVEVEEYEDDNDITDEDDNN